MIRWILGGAALVLGTVAQPVWAESEVQISRTMFVERIVPDIRGGRLRALEPATELRRGDVVVLMLEWSAGRTQNGFIVSSALPRALAYRRSGSAEPEVSVDGGQTFGRLGRLRVGSRLATPEDVTHLRWRIADTAAGRGRGLLAYSAVVR